MALHGDGSIVSWGNNSNGQVSGTPSGTGFSQVAAGDSHSLALRADGSLVSWGADGYGQVSSTPTGTGFIQVAAGYYFSLALRTDGSIVAWGDDGFGEVSNAPGGTGFIQVSGGRAWAMALRTDGSLESWGENAYDVIPNTPTGTGFTQISVGGYNAMVLHSENNGSAYCFGDGSGASCPCSAFGGLGEGCANTSGTGATLIGVGSASLAGDTFQLNVAGVPGDKPGLILRGDNQIAVPAGDGILCTTGSSQRSQVQVTSGGVTTFTDFNGSPFGAVANVGTATNFQFWYRDPASACTGAGFNFTNGWTVTYQP